MRSAVKSIALTPQRSTDPLEHVDYRLAVTPEEKDKIYRLRYRAYLREGAIVPSASERVTDRYDDAPNTWTFGIYLHGELYSSIRVSVLNSEWRGSPSADYHRSDALRCGPREGEALSRTSIRDREARLDRLRLFQCRYRAGECSSGASRLLSQGISARAARRTPTSSRPDKAGGTGGCSLSIYQGKGLPTLSLYAFKRFRTQDVV